MSYGQETRLRGIFRRLQARLKGGFADERSKLPECAVASSSTVRKSIDGHTLVRRFLVLFDRRTTHRIVSSDARRIRVAWREV